MELVAMAVAALIAGLGIGWFLGTRGVAEMRAQRDAREADFKAAAADLARAQIELAETRGQGQGFEERFANLAHRVLGDAQKALLERADQRFHQAGEKSETQLKALLQPVEAVLKRYEQGLNEVEKSRVDQYAALREAVQLLHSSHGQVRDETAKLVNALRASPKSRGRWGEQSLKNVLEQAGLSQFADFATEVSVNTEDGRLRPDVVVRLPGGRKLIVDAKCSLNAYLDATDAVDDATRAAHLKAHAAAIRRHAEQLGSKGYWERFGDAADYVILYIPGEHFLTAALEQDDVLWEWAFERRVLLATPTNLVAIARTVASVWRQEKLAEEAAEIARLGKELHARLATMGEHVGRLGKNLETANRAYNAMVGSLESQVMTQAQRFEALEVANGAKKIEQLPVVETSPRPLTKLIGLAGGAGEEAAE
ncbi:DNA recombination protein RmuC [Sphingomonas canadensis]|uniref:DNA recombination protein RmuC homolog n=1 Tax=Sphingomonas canadensis TaxID=1219257 RepID=A0ABW3H831_9SPHN|nr:DNA recombination protein RmuC [Sphingomonas canadensis]MCW3836722.1 DNA recombination protein RmuC [Sphingomonas canadensis]